jgi:hypothetical protein
MKKFFMFLAVLGLMTVSAQFQVAYAQEETPEATTEDVQAAPEVDEEEIVDPFAAGASDQPMHQALKQKFIEVARALWQQYCCVLSLVSLLLSKGSSL